MGGAATEAKRWAVLIGINGYHESLGELGFCANDARRVLDGLLEMCGLAPDCV